MRPLAARVGVCRLLSAFVLLVCFTPNGLLAVEREKLVIETEAGARFPFAVEIVDTPALRSQGLMFRTRMAGDEGMLFLFDREEVASFWMKNTRLSLDMVFISKSGEILDLHHRAVPGSLKSIRSDMPVSAVLELLGGTARRLGIRAGDRVEHRAFPIRH